LPGVTVCAGGGKLKFTHLSQEKNLMVEKNSVSMHLQQVVDALGARAAAVRIAPEASLLEAIQLLSSKEGRILIVADQNSRSWLGVVTDRQLLKECGKHYETLPRTAVRLIMKNDVVIAHPEDKVDDALSVMANQRIDFIPVVADNQIIAVLTLEDLLQAETTEDKLRIRYLGDYLEGTYNNDVY